MASSFTTDTIELLKYDFTEFPSNDGKGNCSGKGTIPEPTKAKLKTYSENLKALYDIKEDDDKEKLAEAVEKEVAKSGAEEIEERGEKLLQYTSDLCSNSPSLAELKELPPRIQTGFFKWIYKELADPEV